MIEFHIEAQTERYPDMFSELPTAITIHGGTIASALKIVDILERQLIDGSGCDNYYLLIEDPDQE